MKPIARRAITSVCLALSITNLTSCYRTTMQSPAGVLSRSPSARGNRIVAVTTRNGNFVPLDRTPVPAVVNDSLSARVRGEEYRVALSDIEGLWVERIDRGRSALGVIGLGLTVYGMIVFFGTLDDLASF